MFLKIVVHFTIPPAGDEICNCSTFLPTLDFIRFLNYSYYNRCEVVSHVVSICVSWLLIFFMTLFYIYLFYINIYLFYFCFILWFYDYLWASFYILINNCYILFCKRPVPVFCTFLLGIWVFVCVLLSSNYLYKLNNHPLSYIAVVNILSRPMAFFFIFLIVHFKSRHFYFLWSPIHKFPFYNSYILVLWNKLFKKVLIIIIAIVIILRIIKSMDLGLHRPGFQWHCHLLCNSGQAN